MKKLYLIVLVLVGVNIALYDVDTANAKKQEPQEFIEIEEIEVLSEGEPTCHSGGRGASSCSIEAGIQLEAGMSGGCSVTCNAGFYACCDFHCTCLETDPQTK